MACAATASPVLASGFAFAHFGGEHGNVTEANPTALYYNPAGIGLSEDGHLFLDVQVAMRSLTWDHAQAPTDPTSPPANLGSTGRAALFNVLGGPTLAATMRIGDLAVGAGVFAPFYGKQYWSRNSGAVDPDYPLTADGVQRWESISAELSSIYVTAGAAYRLGPLSVGVSGNYIDTRIKFSRAQNLSGQQLPNALDEGRSTVDVAGASGSYGAGILLEAVPRHLWMGASYQAQPGLGAQHLDGSFSAATYPQNRPPQYAPSQGVTLTQALPDIARAGLRVRVGAVEVRAFGDYTRWSVMHSQCVATTPHPCAVYPSGADATGVGAVLVNLRRNWNDTYGGRLGLSVWTSDRLEVFAGGGYETAATPDSTLDPSIADAANVLGSIGLVFAVTPWMHLTGSYTHIQFFDRDTTGLSTLANAMPPTQQPDSGGVYRQWIGLFNTNLDVQF
jgi:long-chain fatty acid transport protein